MHDLLPPRVDTEIGLRPFYNVNNNHPQYRGRAFLGFQAALLVLQRFLTVLSNAMSSALTDRSNSLMHRACIGRWRQAGRVIAKPIRIALTQLREWSFVR